MAARADGGGGGGRRNARGGTSASSGGRRTAEETETAGGGTGENGAESTASTSTRRSSPSGGVAHRLQVYLVPLESYAEVVSTSRCCYELDLSPRPDDENGNGNGNENETKTETTTTADGGVGRAKKLPRECSSFQNPTAEKRAKGKATGGRKRHRPENDGGDDDEGTADDDESAPATSARKGGRTSVSHDYRIHAPRVGPSQVASAPVTVDANGGRSGGVDVVARLKTSTRGRHMVVISNCAAEVSTDPRTNRTTHVPLKARVGKIEIAFVSKFGELPLSMMGIIPFYGALAGLYGMLSLAWLRRSRATAAAPKGGGKAKRTGKPNRRNGCAAAAPPADRRHAPATSPPAPMLGLQRAIRSLVLSQFLFSLIAFTYYLHLNGTSVDVDTLYSGTAAALVNWGPWSMAVATAHFVTVLACQVVVTLATDGTWLIQHHVRPSTKIALYSLSAMWLVYFALYGFLSPGARETALLSFGSVWVAFLLFNVRRSLNNLKALMVGRGNDAVMAGGGALVAKRSLYRKMCAVVGLYPIVFLGSVVWNSNSRQDSWAWVGYVLGDIYLFVILFHSSIMWMPRPRASQEYVKYAPLEMSVVSHNDLDLWEERIGEHWSEEEAEAEHPMKAM